MITNLKDWKLKLNENSAKEKALKEASNHRPLQVEKYKNDLNKLFNIIDDMMGPIVINVDKVNIICAENISKEFVSMKNAIHSIKTILDKDLNHDYLKYYESNIETVYIIIRGMNNKIEKRDFANQLLFDEWATKNAKNYEIYGPYETKEEMEKEFKSGQPQQVNHDY